jgi:lipopolysaccharide export system permease protein
MRLIDRYVIKQFLQTTLFALLAFILIFVVVDLMENLDDFIDQTVPNLIILKYYIVFSPEIIRLMLPVSVLFASLFTTAKMSNVNELTAIKAGGVSLYRFMAPVLIVTFAISIGAIYFGGYVVPLANKNKASIETNFLKRGGASTGSNIFFQDTKSRIVCINFFDEDRNEAVRVSMQDFDPNDATKILVRYDAPKMDYDTIQHKWSMINVSKREFLGYSERISKFPKLDMPECKFTPQDLLIKQQKPEQMNLTELSNAIKNQSNTGNDPTPLKIEYHSRYAFAMTGIIVVLFGLPFSTNKRRGGMAVQVGINILITFIYLVLLKITQAFGKNGALDPLLTAWLVNILFIIAAGINIFRVKQ